MDTAIATEATGQWELDIARAAVQTEDGYTWHLIACLDRDSGKFVTWPATEVDAGEIAYAIFYAARRWGRDPENIFTDNGTDVAQVMNILAADFDIRVSNAFLATSGVRRVERLIGRLNGRLRGRRFANLRELETFIRAWTNAIGRW